MYNRVNKGRVNVFLENFFFARVCPDVEIKVFNFTIQLKVKLNKRGRVE